MPTSLLRQRDHEDSHRVAPVELFFDLVFVFAVTQLSHTLLADLTTHRRAARRCCCSWRCGGLWIYTSWVDQLARPRPPAGRG